MRYVREKYKFHRYADRMPQKHGVQFGTFHVTTNTKEKVPWCTYKDVPQIVIDNLVMTKNVLQAELYAFCILPDHMHFLISPGEKGLSAFMHSFKIHAAREVKLIAPLPAAAIHESLLRNNTYVGSWQKGFHDERIRNARQRSAAFHYIQGNALKHGLASDIFDWPWSSLHFPHLLDPMEIWID